MTHLAFISPGPTEMVVILVVAVLLFGSRLPSVARSMGKSLTEFKKGMQGIEDDVRSAAYSEPPDSIEHSERQEAAGPAFQPPEADGTMHEGGAGEAPGSAGKPPG